MDIIVTKNEDETRDFARDFARDILKIKKENKNATVLALEGILGAGKTTFAQAFAKGLKIKEKVKSPTFLILKEYDIYFENSKFKKFYHIDCYRLENENDILDIGLPEILKNPKNLVLIEWAGNIKKAIPKEAVKIKFYYISENKRKIVII